MGDPRNVAHAKKVTQEKRHKGKQAQKVAASSPAPKAQIEETKSAAARQTTAAKTNSQITEHSRPRTLHYKSEPEPPRTPAPRATPGNQVCLGHAGTGVKQIGCKSLDPN